MFPKVPNNYSEYKEYYDTIKNTLNKITNSISVPECFRIYNSQIKPNTDSGLERLLNALVYLESLKKETNLSIDPYATYIQYERYSYTQAQMQSEGYINWFSSSINLPYATKDIRIFINYIPRNFETFMEKCSENFEKNKEQLQQLEHLSKDEVLQEPPKSITLLEKAYTINDRHRIKIYKSGQTYRIFTNQMNLAINYRIFGTIPALFQDWKFSQDFVDICIAIGTQNLEALKQALNTYLNNINLKKISIESTLKNCTFGNTNALIEAHTQQIASYRSDIKAYEDRITKSYQYIREYSDKIFILQNTDTSAQKEALINFLMKSSYVLSVRALNKATIELTLEAPLTNWDPQAVQRLCIDTNETSSPFCKWLLNKILIEESIILYFTNKIKIDFSHNTVFARPADEWYARKLPNPHLEYFDCWGQNKSETNKYLSEFRYEEALTQIIATVGMMNFYDVTVVNYLNRDLKDLTDMSQVAHSETTFTDSKTGEVYTIQNLHTKYLKEQEEDSTNG